MKKIIVFAFASMLFLACTSKPNKVEQVEKPQMELAEPVVETEEPQIDGKNVFTLNCTPCHGLDGKLGVGGASNLAISELTLEESVEVITKGRNNMMSYANILSGEQITAVAEYLGSLKAE